MTYEPQPDNDSYADFYPDAKGAMNFEVPVSAGDHPDFAVRQAFASMTDAAEKASESMKPFADAWGRTTEQAHKDRVAELDAHYSRLDSLERHGAGYTDKKEWVWVGLFAVILALLFALAASIVLWPSISRADPFTATDRAFISVMHDKGLQATSDAETVLAGHQVCDQLDANGGDLTKAVVWLFKTSKLEDIGDAAFFVGGSVAAYCDEYAPADSARQETRTPIATSEPAISAGVGGKLY